MEDEKAQRLVDTLTKLRKSAGLGVSTHFNFGGASDMIQFRKGKDGKLLREDGLPVNSLYSGFVREGTYDPKISTEKKYGDGRKIKRNFDDINTNAFEKADSIETTINKKIKSKDKKSKEERKAEKKAAKLEAKKAARKAEKLEAKRREKIESRLRMNKNLEKVNDISIKTVKVEKSTNDKKSKSKKQEKKKASDSFEKNDNREDQQRTNKATDSKNLIVKKENKKKKEKKSKL